MAEPAPLPDALVQRAQRGDHAAWAQLLGRDGPAVYALCRRLDHDPDDAYQAIWEKVFRHLDRFDVRGRQPFRSWLLTVAHRHLVDRHRRRRVRAVVVPLAEPPEPATDAAAPDRALDDARVRARVEDAIAALPDAARRVVVLHHIHGQELATIADAEGIALGTVKSRLHRARARLKELLPGLIGVTR